jgi:hypothetical protein
MRLRHFAVAVVAALLIAAPPQREAAAEDLNPPLVGMHDITDDGKMVSISVPQLTEPVKTELRRNDLGVWGMKFNEDQGPPHMCVRLTRPRAFARAVLYASQSGISRNGDVVDGSIRREPNEWREVRFDSAAHLYFTYRMIEHGGEVFEACIWCAEATYPAIKKHIDVILGSFKGAGPPPKPDLPGFKASDVSGREVWTDAKSKADLDHVLAIHTDVWERMKTLVPPNFADTGNPRIVICKDDASYAQVAKLDPAAAAPPPTAFDDARLRAVVVSVSPASKKFQFDRQIERCVGMQCVEAAYGGALPGWFEEGLAILNLFITGKGVSADKPNPVALKNAKAAFAKRPETLADFLDRPVNVPVPPQDTTDLDGVCWLWHLYLRANPQTDEGARYRKYAETLETSGDVGAARAAFDGANFAAMKSSMGKWLESK